MGAVRRREGFVEAIQVVEASFLSRESNEGWSVRNGSGWTYRGDGADSTSGPG